MQKPTSHKEKEIKIPKDCLSHLKAFTRKYIKMIYQEKEETYRYRIILDRIHWFAEKLVKI
jgi:hypothetical protein